MTESTSDYPHNKLKCQNDFPGPPSMPLGYYHRPPLEWTSGIKVNLIVYEKINWASKMATKGSHDIY